MTLRSRLATTAAAACLALVLAAPRAAQAVLLFDTGTFTGVSFTNAGEGFGQGVTVSTTTNLTSFSLLLDVGASGNVKFMIWDGTNSNLLYSEVDAIASNGNLHYVSTTGLGSGFTLNAGSKYYFGAIADVTWSHGFISSATPVDTNGLASVNELATNYLDFSNPTARTLLTRVNIPLQLFGDQTQVEEQGVPEPATLALLGFGLAGLGLARRRRAA